MTSPDRPPLARRKDRRAAMPIPPRGNLATQHALAAAQMFKDDGYPKIAQALHAIVCEYQTEAAKRFYDIEELA